MKIIRDGQGKQVGQVVENGSVVYIRNGTGQPKGQYHKTSDKTFDARGRFAGPGDQLLRMLDK
jgi:imidazolonepropionase-like amidohydrolase